VLALVSEKSESGETVFAFHNFTLTLQFRKMERSGLKWPAFVSSRMFENLTLTSRDEIEKNKQ